MSTNRKYSIHAMDLAQSSGFVHVAGHAFLDEPALTDGREIDSFCASWEDLAEDTYMADSGSYRLRRHATFSVARGVGCRKAAASTTFPDHEIQCSQWRHPTPLLTRAQRDLQPPRDA